MAASAFVTSTALRRDLKTLGFDTAECESSFLSEHSFRSALHYLANIVDRENAPQPDSPDSDLDQFWEAFGIPASQVALERSPSHLQGDRGESWRSLRLVTALRFATDLALASREKCFSTDNTFLPEDADTDSSRIALIENLYEIFPRSVPVHPEPKFKPKRKRPPQPKDGGTREKAREPVTILRDLTEATRNMDNILQPPNLSARYQLWDDPHSKLLHATDEGSLSQGGGANYPEIADIEKLVVASHAASESGHAFSRMISEAMALYSSSSGHSERDLSAETLLRQHVHEAISAHAAMDNALKAIKQMSTAYSVLDRAPQVPSADMQEYLRDCKLCSERAICWQRRLPHCVPDGSDAASHVNI